MKIKSFANTFLVFLIATLLCSDAMGQNADSLNYKFDFQIGGQRKRGVFSQTALRITSNNHLENKRWILSNSSSYTYTEANGFVIADDWHFRSMAMLKLNSTKKLLPVFLHNYLKNVLYRISGSHRTLAGFRIIPFKKIEEISFTVGAGYETSNYMGEVFLNSSDISNQRDFALGFFHFVGSHKLEKSKTLFEYNFSAVQSFDEKEDFAFWATLGVSVPVGKKFRTGVNYDYRYRNVHLEDIPKVNDLLMFNLKINLSKG